MPRQLVLVCALIKMPRRLLNLRVDLHTIDAHPTHWLICHRFSNWGKAASPEKLKHEAAVAALTAQIQLIELEASQRDPLF